MGLKLRTGSKLHEIELVKVTKKLKQKGYRVIDLKGLSPDAIAIKDGKVIAVEVLGCHWRDKPRKSWHAGWTHRGKKRLYSMFDEVMISTFRYPPPYKNNSETVKEKANETSNKLKIVLAGKRLRTTEILHELSSHITRRQLANILQSLRNEGILEKEIVSKGRGGRYCLWSLKTE